MINEKTEFNLLINIVREEIKAIKDFYPNHQPIDLLVFDFDDEEAVDKKLDDLGYTTEEYGFSVSYFKPLHKRVLMVSKVLDTK